MTLSRSGEAARRERVRLRRIKGQTVCPNGHDLTLPKALAGRQCRACHRDHARKNYHAIAATSQTGVARERMRSIDVELLQLIDDHMRADGPQGRQIKARMLALRTEKDSLDAQLRKAIGDHE